MKTKEASGGKFLIENINCKTFKNLHNPELKKDVINFYEAEFTYEEIIRFSKEIFVEELFSGYYEFITLWKHEDYMLFQGYKRCEKCGSLIKNEK